MDDRGSQPGDWQIGFQSKQEVTRRKAVVARIEGHHFERHKSTPVGVGFALVQAQAAELRALEGSSRCVASQSRTLLTFLWLRWYERLGLLENDGACC